MSESVSGGPSGLRPEARSTDYVPEHERHGKVWHQGPFWFMANANLTTALTGVIGVSLGLNLAWALVAVVAGSALGTFFSAFHAVQGPRLGLPQMIQSRVQFGARGSVVPLAVAAFVQLGFCVFFVILGRDSLGQVTSPHPTLFGVGITIAAALVAIVGYELVHRVQRWLTLIVLLNFALLTGAILAEAPVGKLLGAGAFGWTAFLAQFGASAGYQIAIAPIVSDYSRYLRADVATGRVVAAVFAGSIGSAIWLEALGAIAAAGLPKLDTVGALHAYGNQWIDGLGTATLIITVPAVIAVIAISVYSGVLTVLSIADAFRAVRSSARLRAVTISVASVIVYLGVVLMPEDFLADFGSFLALLFYFLVPWTAVNLVDFYLVRRGRYAIAEIMESDGGIYGRWGRVGLASYAIGIVAMVPFFSTTLFTGPLAKSIGADVSVLIGLPVSGLVYWALMRRVDLSHEGEALVRDAGRLGELAADRAAVRDVPRIDLPASELA